MTGWTAFPYAGDYRFDPARVREQWSRLHASDAEPLPSDEAMLAAWARFHAGDFEQATAEGLAVGDAGITVANKAQATYAHYLEKSEKARLELLLEVAERAEAQAAADPANPNAWYFIGYALGRYSQGISIAKALAQGLGSKVKHALEKTIELAPHHADAHVALGAFHAEVIDKTGSLVGRTQGASKDAGIAAFKAALRLAPDSPIAKIEYANALVMLEGDKMLGEANRLYQEAAEWTAIDAKERLDVEVAKAGLEE